MSTSLKFLHTRMWRRPWIMAFPLILAIGLGVLIALENENLGGEDYLICKMMCALVGVFGSAMVGVFTCADITGARFMRSTPLAPALYTRALPVFFTELSLAFGGGFAVVVGVILCFMPDSLQQISDLILLTSILLAFSIVMLSIFAMINYGMVIMIYACVFPIGIVAGLLPDSISKNGFGFPLWGSVLISVGVLAVAILLSFGVCSLLYRKINFKPYVQTMTQ